MKSSRKLLLCALVVVLVAGLCVAQGRRSRRFSQNGIIYTEGGEAVDENTVRTAREIASHSTGTPDWTNTPGFEKDVFTFARLIRDRAESRYGGRWGGGNGDGNGGEYCSPTAGNWITDFPDSDLNLSYRVQQMTSIKVDPNGRTLRITDPDLFNYPWVYTVEPGGLLLRDEEVPILRKYLLNGGVLMVDDFWGDWQWDFFAKQMKRVFPNRDFEDLPIEHPIFHCVFDLKGSVQNLQTPGERVFLRNGRDPSITWEVHPRQDGSGRQECHPMHVRAIMDDKRRIMVIATHNCDNGDGWEREGEYDDYFHEFSEKRAFPLGINIIFYVMTH